MYNTNDLTMLYLQLIGFSPFLSTPLRIKKLQHNSKIYNYTLNTTCQASTITVITQFVPSTGRL